MKRHSMPMLLLGILVLFALSSGSPVSGPIQGSGPRHMSLVARAGGSLYLPFIRKVGGGPTPTVAPASPTVPAPTATTEPTLTVPAPTSTPIPPTPTATQEPGIIVNGSFEQGQGHGWKEYNNRTIAIPLVRLASSVAFIDPTIQATSGQWLAVLFAREWLEDSQIFQTVKLPASGPFYLNFNYRVLSEEMCDVGYYDQFQLTINNQVIMHELLCWDDHMNNWAAYSIEGSQLAGQTVEIRFRAWTCCLDFGRTYVLLDDICIEPTPRTNPVPCGSGR